MRSWRIRAAGLTLLLPGFSWAQVDSVQKESGIWRFVQLPEFTVGAEELDLEAFMEQVINDTTFYHAFLNTRYHPHRVRSNLMVRNKEERETASLYREAHLVRTGRLAELVVDSAVERGRLRERDGDMRYLTAEMYDDVFFPKGQFTASNRIASRSLELQRTSRFDKYKSELKKFMFNPGQEIASVPFVGAKLDIFTPEMVPLYDYRLTDGYHEGQHCWVFTVLARDSVDGDAAEDDDTVIKRMVTWFDMERLQVLAREYRIEHASIFLDFDISIRVENSLVEGELVPIRVQYDGDWDIPFKKRELIRFWSDYSDWTISR